MKEMKPSPFLWAAAMGIVHSGHTAHASQHITTIITRELSEVLPGLCSEEMCGNITMCDCLNEGGDPSMCTSDIESACTSGVLHDCVMENELSNVEAMLCGHTTTAVTAEEIETHDDISTEVSETGITSEPTAAASISGASSGAATATTTTEATNPSTTSTQESQQTSTTTTESTTAALIKIESPSDSTSIEGSNILSILAQSLTKTTVTPETSNAAIQVADDDDGFDDWKGWKIETGSPTSSPTTQPSFRPSSEPSSQPTSQPSLIPSGSPSEPPSSQPSSQPSNEPSSEPSDMPSTSASPTSSPSSQPSIHPTTSPSSSPSVEPSSPPSESPSSVPSASPSVEPTETHSASPSSLPTLHPSIHPTASPSSSPSIEPTAQPSSSPSSMPSASPSHAPSSVPTVSSKPSSSPSFEPSFEPTSAKWMLHHNALKDGNYVDDYKTGFIGVTTALSMIVFGGVLLIGLYVFKRRNIPHRVSNSYEVDSVGESSSVDENPNPAATNHSKGFTSWFGRKKSEPVENDPYAQISSYGRKRSGHDLPSITSSQSYQYSLEDGIAPTPRSTHATSQTYSAYSFDEGSSVSSQMQMTVESGSEDFTVKDQVEQSVAKRDRRRTVFAPAGKLGIIVDTSTEGPVVHGLKDDSPLVGKVVIGDLIVAVDDEDTSGWSAHYLTKLVARKSDSVRKLTLCSPGVLL